ncbi:MAG: CCA tRNA nucleotidyltransferase [Chloroflexota bacterium]
MEKLWSAGHGAYLVGGGVRDSLLGLRPSEWDATTDARPERILAIFPGSTYQNRFGTVLARNMEITTFRRDHRYADHRRPERVTFSDDVYEDLARRDLTINAIAWGRRGPDAEARLLDPADGAGDLRARLVRAVGDPDRRFDEDALRLLRAVRIAARLDFSIEPLTLAAMSAHASDISWVSEERVGSEIRRMLKEGAPSRAFRLMDETGILAATMPELADLKSEPARQRTDQPRSRFDHSLDTLAAATRHSPGQERSALAGLLHSMGPSRARTILERLRVSGRDADAICQLIETLSTDYRPDWSDAAVRRFMRAVGAELLDDLLQLRRAHDEADAEPEATARYEELRSRVETQRLADVPLTLGELAIDGADLRTTLGIPESPAIGVILDRLLEDVIDDPSLNRRMTLLTRASLVLDELTQPGAQSLPSSAAAGHGTADRPRMD